MLNTADGVSLSAAPINQVWPGYQRPVEQSKISSFVSFDLAAPGELAVTSDAADFSRKQVVLPMSFKPLLRREGSTWFVAVDKPRQFILLFDEKNEPLPVFANPPFDAPARPSRCLNPAPSKSP